MVRQRLLGQLLPGLPLRHLLHQFVLLAGLDQNFFYQTRTNLVFNDFGDLGLLDNLLAGGRDVFDGLSVNALLGDALLELFQCGVVDSNQGWSWVGVLVEAGDTSWSYRQGVNFKNEKLA